MKEGEPPPPESRYPPFLESYKTQQNNPQYRQKNFGDFLCIPKLTFLAGKHTD